MTLTELHRRFRRYCHLEEGLSPLSTRAMEYSLGMLVRHMGEDALSAVSQEIVRDFLYDGRELKQWSYWTYVNHHKYLKRFFAWCVSLGYLKTNPLDGIKKPRKPQALPRRLSQEEAQAILYASMTHRWRFDFERVRNHAMITMLLFAGLRANELLNLQVSDVDLKESTIFVQSGKGGKDRYVPIHEKLAYVLRRYLSERKRLGKMSPALFTSTAADGPLRYKALNTICQKLSATAGVRFSPHQLRHTFASVATEQHVGLYQLKEIMGHSSITSTMIYLKTSPKALTESLNRLDLF